MTMIQKEKSRSRSASTFKLLLLFLFGICVTIKLGSKRPQLLRNGDIKFDTISVGTTYVVPKTPSGDGGNGAHEDAQKQSGSDGSSSSSSGAAADNHGSEKEKSKKDSGSDTSAKQSDKKQRTSATPTVEYPLKPPFHLMQLGTPRTGSTFQVSLLDAIATLKTRQVVEDPPEIELRTKTPSEPRNGTVPPFVMKSHHSDLEGIKAMIREHREKYGIDIHLFTSSRDDDQDMTDFSTFSEISLYQQTLPNLYECSLCEVDKYAPIFGLTPEDVSILKEYMSRFEIIRQCCGMQQSKYNRYRLHGCNVTQLLEENPDVPYPYCENHDIETVEIEFAVLPIPFRSRSTKDNWAKPGDCARFETKITENGRDFNGKKFKSCDTFLDQYSPEQIARQQIQRNKVLTNKRESGGSSKTKKNSKKNSKKTKALGR